MMLDNHRIVIRERGHLELLDLGLRVLRSQAGPLFVALLAGVGPFVVLNAWLLNRAAAVRAGDEPPWLFLFLMLIAVLWELPLATAPATMCLGRALFNQPLKAGQIVREFAQSLPQLIFYQVLLRGLLMATVAGSFVPFIRSLYLNEVILLERNPLRRGTRQWVEEEIDIHGPTEFDAASRSGRRFLRPLDSHDGDRSDPGGRDSGARWPRRHAACSTNGVGAVPSIPACIRPRSGSWPLISPSCGSSAILTFASAAKVGRWNC